MNITKPTTAKEIKRAWHLVDVKGEVIGRVANKIAILLMGKSKPYFSRNMDCGDFVVVVNSDFVKITGKKSEQKFYRKHSMYPGGFKEVKFKDMKKKNSRVIVLNAVKGMLPDNKLKKQLLKRLFIFKDENHKYKEKFQV